ncbi:MAG: tripartite tricarboxylate transporter substrate binding protein BugD [Alphaproteobacteria bacterium]|nr:tripartite tricarboxylate transporter substrate binding protein BugD [Alphaproteobacteria bacterium]
MRRSILALAAILISAAGAQAQSYPNRPITMVVPFPAGGATTVLARIVGEHMKGALGQPVIIENIGGASGSLGTGRAARAAPDGYTLSFGNWASHVGSGAMYSLQFDLHADLVPVAFIANSPLWVVAKNGFPARDLKEFIAWLKANPGKGSAATVGVGSGSHMCGIYIQSVTKTEFQFVPYRGGAPAMQDLVGGQVDFMCDFAGNSLPNARNGQIRPIAVMAKQRWFAMPNVPTFEEMGIKGLEMSFWHGLWAPKGTDKEIVARLNAAVRAAFADPTVKARYNDMGQELPAPAQQSPEALARFHKAETDKWWPIIKAANIKIQ